MPFHWFPWCGGARKCPPRGKQGKGGGVNADTPGGKEAALRTQPSHPQRMPSLHTPVLCSLISMSTQALCQQNSSYPILKLRRGLCSGPDVSFPMGGSTCTGRQTRQMQMPTQSTESNSSGQTAQDSQPASPELVPGHPDALGLLHPPVRPGGPAWPPRQVLPTGSHAPTDLGPGAALGPNGTRSTNENTSGPVWPPFQSTSRTGAQGDVVAARQFHLWPRSCIECPGVSPVAPNTRSPYSLKQGNNHD